MKYVNYFKITSQLDYILIGAIIYIVAFHIILPISKVAYYLLIGLSLMITLYPFLLRKYRLTKPIENSFIFYLFLFICIFVIIRGYENLINVPSTIIHYRGMLGYLTPFILFLGINNLSLKSVLKFCYLSSLIAIIFVLLNFKEIFLTSHMILFDLTWDDPELGNEINMGQIPGYFLIPGAFLLFNSKYIPKSHLRLTWIAFVLSIGTSVAYGRRSYIVFHLIILSFIIVNQILYENNSRFKRILYLIIAFFVSIIVLYIFSQLSIFDVLNNRFDQDSRIDVVNSFYSDFKGKTLDWLFGRGIGGRYYDSSFNQLRPVIEAGYLQFILNGGLIILFLYLLVLLKAVYLGFFKSKNNMCKSMAFFVLANVLFLFSGNSIEFTIKGVLIWVFVGYLYNDKFRNMYHKPVYNRS